VDTARLTVGHAKGYDRCMHYGVKVARSQTWGRDLRSIRSGAIWSTLVHRLGQNLTKMLYWGMLLGRESANC